MTETELKIQSLRWEEAIKKELFKYLDTKKYKAFLFGSRARWNYRYNSDYDIGIQWEKALEYMQLGKIKRELDELPYLIDVVDFNTVDDDFKNLALKYTKAWN